MFSEFICEVVVGLFSVSLDVRWLWVCRYWWSCWSSLLKFSLHKNICLVWGLGVSVFLYYRELKKVALGYKYLKSHNQFKNRVCDSEFM